MKISCGEGIFSFFPPGFPKTAALVRPISFFFFLSLRVFGGFAIFFYFFAFFFFSFSWPRKSGNIFLFFFPLADGDIEIVQIITVPPFPLPSYSFFSF